jgi:hypothetical protein
MIHSEFSDQLTNLDAQFPTTHELLNMCAERGFKKLHEPELSAQSVPECPSSLATMQSVVWRSKSGSRPCCTSRGHTAVVELAGMAQRGSVGEGGGDVSHRGDRGQ